jgi:hypothetical protein
MQPQANVDMGLIREALARRQQGGLGGGTSMPAAAQLTAGGASPMGAPQTQQAPGSQQSTPALGQLPTQVPQGAGTPTPSGQLKAGQQAQGPQFDDETRTLAKSLVERLLKGL